MTIILNFLRQFWQNSNQPNVVDRSLTKAFHGRFVLVWGVVFLIFVVLVSRAFFVQIKAAPQVEQMLHKQMIRTSKIKVNRGALYDRNGTPLAITTPMFAIAIDARKYLAERPLYENTVKAFLANPDDPKNQKQMMTYYTVKSDLSMLKSAIKAHPNDAKYKALLATYKKAVPAPRPLWVTEFINNPNTSSHRYSKPKTSFDLSHLATILSIDYTLLESHIKKYPNRPELILKHGVTPEMAENIRRDRYNNVIIKRTAKRFYPQAQPNAQLLGFTDTRQDGMTESGAGGLEKLLDQRLSGTAGEEVIIGDTKGFTIKHLKTTKPAIEGENIHLSIDARLQYIMYRELASAGEFFKARSVSSVALNVKTGEVLAMTSWPSFNPNDKQHRLDNLDATRNRAMIDTFEPASTMKPLTISAALESGLFKLNSKIDTNPGTLSIGKFTIRDHGNNGVMSLGDIIMKSSNVGSARIALQLPKETLPDFFKKMGIGQRSNLNFPAESKGRVPSAKTVGNSGLASMSYGYGISTNVLQLAHAYATIGNGGVLLPLSFEKLQHPPKGIRVFDETIANAVLGMMEGVVSDQGTAPKAAVTGYRIAGKTGTAHKANPEGGYSKTEYRSLFIGVAPISNPQIAIAVVVENPEGEYFGGLVAAPVFSKIMQDALRLQNVTPDKPF